MKDSNIALAREQIRKHGVDRYPTTSMQFNKLIEEVGELAKAINQDRVDRITSEMADVALALYNLSDKCKVNLDLAIRDTVSSDTRKFA